MKTILPNTTRNRLVLCLLSVALVPLTFASIQAYRFGKDAILEIVHLHLISVVEARQDLIERWFDERRQDMAGLASLPDLRDAIAQEAATERPQNLNSLMDWFVNQSPEFDAAIVCDADWNVLADSSGDEHSLDEFRTSALLEGFVRGDALSIDIEHGHIEGMIGLHMGSQIRDRDEVLLGYVLANLNLSTSLDPLLQERSGLWDTGKAYLTTPQRLILNEPFANSVQKVALQMYTSPDVILGADSTVPERRQYTDYLGHQVVGVARALAIRDWILIAEMDTSEAFRWLNTLLLQLLLTTIVTVVIIVPSSTVLARTLTRPFAELARVAHRVRSGHGRERIPPLSGSEPEEVRKAFNEMLDELASQNKRIVEQSTLASVGELGTRIVHEIRNPLSTIKLNAQALQKVIPANADDQELARITIQQIIRIERMLSDLLQYGRPLELDVAPVKFGNLVDEATRSVEAQARMAGVEITSPEQSRQAKVYVDKEHFLRALGNLLRNSVEASRPGSTITVLARRPQSDPNLVVVSVIDAGSGLDARTLDNLFKPFHSTKSLGTGLGLANVKKIVELHGGWVTARNRPEGGAEFDIWIPLNLPKHASGGENDSRT